jgi:hypothetical protein
MGKRLKDINWKSYNRELIGRGSITFWVCENAIAGWFNVATQGCGFQKIYSDLAIQLLLILRCRFSLTLRGTQGFAESIFNLMRLKLAVPNYTTLSRRASKLEVKLRDKMKNSGSIHVVIDSTGLKVFGEGEWKVRQHGYSKRRTWRKLHLCVDEASGEILSSVLTENSFKDNEIFEDLISSVSEEIYQASGDGAYDAKNCWELCEDNNIFATFPPRENAKIQIHGNSKTSPSQRDQHLRAIRLVGKPMWKVQTNYTRRSISETTMYRFKTIFGDKLRAKNFENQATEAFIKCKILNLMKTPAVLS